MDVDPFLPQKGHGFHTIGGDVQLNGRVGVVEGFLREPDIAGTVFDQEKLYGHVFSCDNFHDCLLSSRWMFFGLTLAFRPGQCSYCGNLFPGSRIRPTTSRGLSSTKGTCGTRHSAPVAVMAFCSFAAKPKRKVEPRPGVDSTEMLPPCRSTIFLQMAKPIPVPANSSRLCRRWNMPKIFSKYCEFFFSASASTEN